MGTYVFSDLHGNYNLWTTIKNYYGSKDTLIFLGDACDRGSNGIKIIKEMFEDNRIIYILGNHEAMLLNYLKNPVKYLTSPILKRLSVQNGCIKTYKDCEKMSNKDKEKLINNLTNKTKEYYIYINRNGKNFFLSHAGIDLKNINNFNKDELLWDRKHIKSNEM